MEIKEKKTTKKKSSDTQAEVVFFLGNSLLNFIRLIKISKLNEFPFGNSVSILGFILSISAFTIHTKQKVYFEHMRWRMLGTYQW